LRKWKNTDVIKIKHRKILLGLALLTVGLAGFDIIYGKYTLYDIGSLPVGIFGIWAIGFGGLYKISRYLTELQLKKRDNKFDYYHT